MTELGQSLDNMKGAYADKVGYSLDEGVFRIGVSRPLSITEHLHHPSSSSGEMLALPRFAKIGFHTV